MRTEIRCPVAKTAMQKTKPGDGLIRHWLAWQGWRVGHVRDGVVYLPSVTHAEYIEDLLERKWFPDAPTPLVGVYYPEEV